MNETYSTLQKVDRGLSAMLGIDPDRKVIQDRAMKLQEAQAGLEYDPNTGQYKPRAGTQASLNEQVVSQLQQDLNDLRKKLVINDQIETIDSAISTGSYDSLNRLIAKDPTTQKMFRDELGVQAIYTTDFKNPKHLDAMKQAGINPEVVAYLAKGVEEGTISQEEVNAISKAWPVVQTVDNRFTVASLPEFIGATGMLQQMKSEEKVKKWQDFTAMAYKSLEGVTSRAYQANIANIEAQTAATTTKTMEDQISLGLLEKWVEDNPNASVKEFLEMQAKAKASAEKSKGMSPTDVLSMMKLQEAEVENVTVQNTDEVLSQLDSDSNTIAVGGYAVNKYKAAKALQGDAKPGTEDTNYIDGLYDASKQMQGLYKKFESVDRNAITTGMDKVSKILGVEWASKTADEQIKDLNRIQIDAELRTIIAGYIKTMSGAAVTNEERQLFYDTILGGNWSNKDEAMATMRGFISSVNNTLSSRLDGYKDRFPSTYLREKDRLKKVMEFKEGEKPSGDTQAVSKVPQPGAVVNGYQFKGGNPKDPNNWIKVK